MIDLDAIEARCKAAFKGPWELCAKPPNDTWRAGYTIGEARKGGRRIGDITPFMHPAEARANGEFIAHARTDVEQMAQALREIRTNFEAWTAPECACGRCEWARKWLARWFGKST